MGGESASYWENERLEKQRYLTRQKDQRRKVADTIVTALETEIIDIIIRPGPKPEERECTTVADEIRNYHVVLIEKIIALIPYRIYAESVENESDDDDE